MSATSDAVARSSPVPAAAPLLQLAGLCCERDHRELYAGLDLSLGAGEVLWVQGGNGSGKTTLLRALVGLAPDCTGEVSWAEGVSPLYLGHRLGLSAPLSAAENLAWLASLRGQDPEAAAISAALAATGLAGFDSVPCAEMSAGQQRRVALARLWLEHSGVWLLDEPLTALDSAGVALVSARISAHAQAGGAAVVTSHQPLAAATRSLELAGSTLPGGTSPGSTAAQVAL